MWQTLYWLDLYSRYALGHFSAPSLKEAMVIASLLTTVKEHGLPYIAVEPICPPHSRRFDFRGEMC